MNKRELDFCNRARQALEVSKVRLADLEERGTEALSKYDIEIAHGGDAEQALETAIWLKRNHVSYFSEQLETCPPPVQQITLFDATEGGQ